VAQQKRKGQPAKTGGHGMFYVVLGVIALAGIAAIFYAVRGGAGGNGSAATEMVALDVADARELYDRASPHRLGEDAAPTKIVVFSDFMCPGCAAFGLNERARLMPWIESGEAQYVAYDYPLGGRFVHSVLAARAARCAEEQQVAGSPDGTGFWPFHDMLYQRQSAWSGQQSAVDTFVGYGDELGFDRRSFEQCVRSDRFADVVTANRMLGDQLGVTGTPTVLVNNRRIGGNTINQMGDAVIRILQESSPGEGAASGQ
jgi:protein-disulfide isomerase